MFKGQPKGLFVTALANLGERFGYYTMIAIFVLFLQAKYGYSEAAAGKIYAYFLMFVYFLPLFGGIIADRWLGYRRSVTIGMVIMFIGYMLLAFPNIIGGKEIIAIFAALAVIALGTGLFKGNLQALVGRMYDNPHYSAKRDSGFSLYYMFINVGAMFAPTAAQGVVNFVMHKVNLTYDSRIPELFHKMETGGLSTSVKNEFLSIARLQDASVSMDSLHQFGSHYINALGGAYQLGFGVACVSLVASLAIFLIGRKTYMIQSEKVKNAQKQTDIATEEITPAENRERIIALCLVFVAVIFFWMAFHQNGLTLTYFARDYTDTSVGQFTNIWFDLFTLIPVAISVVCIGFAVKKYSLTERNTVQKRLIYGVIAVIAGVWAYIRISGFAVSNPFTPQLFQHFNPFFIVVLTPVAVGIFNALGKKGKEPSAPKKIAYGMLISFVSKVAPPKLKGMMQGGWFAATAAGNFLIQIGSYYWIKVPLWSLWMIFVVCCLLSAFFMFSIMKKLEKVAK